MPELPDIEAYLFALRARIVGHRLTAIRLQSVFFLRTVEPPTSAAVGRVVSKLRRVGKRIVMALEDEAGDHALFLVLHLMIAGRLHWREVSTAPVKLSRRGAFAAFDFDNGTLTVTEAGSKRRASLHIVAGEAALAEIDRGGIDPLNATLEQFRASLTAENRTVKRALTDPRILSGIGNAYSDEILHEARLSPVVLTRRLTDDQWQALYVATQSTLLLWRDRLIAEAARSFPEKVTAFRPEMAVHGRFNRPCPRCSSPIQRIRFADNETNYCPTCQTDGKLLADRSLSRLLRSDWPRSLDELEMLKRS